MRKERWGAGRKGLGEEEKKIRERVMVEEKGETEEGKRNGERKKG